MIHDLGKGDENPISAPLQPIGVRHYSPLPFSAKVSYEAEQYIIAAASFVTFVRRDDDRC